MSETLPSDALRLAINALRDIAESRQMPSGMAIDMKTANLHADAADELEVLLTMLRQSD